MKKIILLVTICIIFCFSSFSQVHKHSIGIRYGLGIYSTFMEVSYQNKLSDHTRLELDLGSSLSIYIITITNQITGSYQWSKKITNGLNCYAGPAASFSVNLFQAKAKNSYIDFGAGGQLGLEYNFNHLNCPLQISLDARPIVQFRHLMFAEKWKNNGAKTKEDKDKINEDALRFALSQIINIGISIRYTF